jgi:hypothetical protein
VTPTLEDLAEAPPVYFLPVAEFELVDRGDLVLEVFGRRGAVHLQRLVDVEEAVEWARREAREREVSGLRWWVGWRAEPADLVDRLLDCGLAWDEMPHLLGMTAQTEPPRGPADVEVREVRTADELLETIEVDWEVWGVPEESRVDRRVRERRRFDPDGPVRHFASYLDGRAVGFGRAVEMAGGVALMGGTVIPEARGRGIYRALVHARWEHAVARGTPLLVTQAGPMSAPILAELGFVGHGEVHVLVDPGVAS